MAPQLHVTTFLPHASSGVGPHLLFQTALYRNNRNLNVPASSRLSESQCHPHESRSEIYVICMDVAPLVIRAALCLVPFAIRYEKYVTRYAGWRNYMMCGKSRRTKSLIFTFQTSSSARIRRVCVVLRSW